MKSRMTLIFGLVLALGCGRGGAGDGGTNNGGGTGTCLTGCAAGFQCMAGSCVLAPTGAWVLTLDSGQLSEKRPDGSSWDGIDGLPDTAVCLTINGARSCSGTAQDTLRPGWGQSFPAATALALQAGVAVEIIERDVAFDDLICRGTVPVDPAQFAAGRWGVQCPGVTLSFSLSPR